MRDLCAGRPAAELMFDQISILQARGLTVDYPGVRALDGIAFDLRAGEIHALMGENGAGKSTLINVISGAVRPNAGTISLCGRVVRFNSPRDAERAGVSAVHQEIDLISTMSVAENITLGRQPRRFGLINHRAIRRRAESALAMVGLQVNLSRMLCELPIAAQQLVSIARALEIEASVLILDEPTSSLDAKETHRLFDVLRRLRNGGAGRAAGGLAIVFVSHFIGQVYELADRISVLRNGRNAGTWKSGDLSRAALIEAMTGRNLESQLSSTRSANSAQPVRLRVDRLARRATTQPISFMVRHGESLGLAGLLGSGRSELARLIFGVDRPDAGVIAMDGQPIRGGSVRTAIAAGMGFTPEDRRQALALDLSVRENIVLAMQASRGALRSLSLAQQNAIAEKYIAAMAIRTPHAEAAVRTLSGGNQQKVLLARWLAMQPRVLILDEPARGVDIGARADIEALVRSLQDAGVSVVFISSEIDEIVRVCDRVLVLRDRAPVGEVASISESAILAMIAGSDAGSASTR